MPKANNGPVLQGLSHGQFVRLRRKLLSAAIELMRPVFFAEVEPTFDDAVTVSVLTAIGISEDKTHPCFPQWLSHLKFMVRQMELFIELDDLEEEFKEERRRCVSPYAASIPKQYGQNQNLTPSPKDCGGQLGS